MKIYWSLPHVPEFAALSKKERSEVWRSCIWNVWGRREVWLILLGYAAVTPIWLLFPGFAGAGVAGGLGGFICAQVSINTVIPDVRAEAARRAKLSGHNLWKN